MRSITTATKKLNLLETEEAIFFIKQTFQKHLAWELDLSRVSAPLFLEQNSGMQDNLNGKERPVSFEIPSVENNRFEIVHSLAKWKRYALAKYKIPTGQGLYTDMNAIRPDEENLETDIHSVYVDQWDWEKAITPDQRNLETLFKTVNSIYKALKITESEIESRYGIDPILPDSIAFIHAGKLAEQYRHLTPKERENRVCQEYKAVFLIGIGGLLADGKPHDGRAPDYDDWTTPNSEGTLGLNGDILVWNPVLNRAFELSSMGIRVDKETLLRQLHLCGCTGRCQLSWHQMLLSGALPQSIGGGIGQSRLCMFLLRKKHIGEVQVSSWPGAVISACQVRGISLL